MQRDLRVSSLSALANFIITGIMVAGGWLVVPGFPEFAATGVGLVVGFRGNDNVPEFVRKWMKVDDERGWRGRPLGLVPGQHPRCPHSGRPQAIGKAIRQ